MNGFVKHMAAGVVAMFAVLSPQISGASEVQAVWSQISGQTTAPDGSGLAALNVRMRFVLAENSKHKCDDFAVTRTQGTEKVSWIARTNNSYGELVVCDAPMDESWNDARLVLKNGSDVYVSVRNPTTVKALATFAGPAMIGRRQFQQSKKHELKVAVFGDSGCRGNRHPKPQDCDTVGDKNKGNSNQWQFPAVALGVTTKQKLPDFVLHVGDYRYNHGGSTPWERWYNDFFVAAQPSLLQVPWAFSRGNHESCSSGIGAPGWLLFFGSTNKDCAAAGGVDVSVSYFDVAIRSNGLPSSPHRFIMVDTAQSAWRATQNLHGQFSSALEWSLTGWKEKDWSAPASSWIATHRPVWGIDTQNVSKQNDLGVEHVLFTAVGGLKNQQKNSIDIGACAPYDSDKCGLRAIVSGHQHELQNIVFPSDDNSKWLLPQQFVVGNSGIGTYNRTPDCKVSFKDGGMTNAANGNITGNVVNWNSHYGYVVWTRGVAIKTAEQSGWVGEAQLIDRSQNWSVKKMAGRSGDHSQPRCNN